MNNIMMTIDCSFNSACMRLERYINTRRFTLATTYNRSKGEDTFTVNGEIVATFTEIGGLVVYNNIRKYALTLGDIPGGTAMRTIQSDTRERDAEGAILAQQESWGIFD